MKKQILVGFIREVPVTELTEGELIVRYGKLHNVTKVESELSSGYKLRSYKRLKLQYKDDLHSIAKKDWAALLIKGKVDSAVSFYFEMSCVEFAEPEQWDDVGLLYTDGEDLRKDTEYTAFYGFLDWLEEEGYEIKKKL